ncbi:MAG: ABC transporter substrate-binding protein [Pleomorphochaeta sp.]
MKKLLLLLFVSSLLMPIFAQGTKETTEQPTEVVIYASVDEENSAKLFKAFEEDTGITVKSVHLSSGPALARIEAEKDRPQADVWFGAPSENHISAKTAGLTIQYISPELDGLGENFKDPEGYWRCIYMNPLCFGINTKALEKAGATMPTSWEDLTKPEYNDLIQAPTPQASGTARAEVFGLCEIMGEDGAFKYMARLNKNIQTYTSSGTGPSKGVNVGDCAIGIQFTPAFFQYISQGLPVKVVFPVEGVPAEAPAVSILKGAKNLKAAQIFVDWMTGIKGQNALSEEETFFYPVLATADLAEGMPAFNTLKIIPYDTDYYSANSERLVQRWVNEVLTAK